MSYDYDDFEDDYDYDVHGNKIDKSGMQQPQPQPQPQVQVRKVVRNNNIPNNSNNSNNSNSSSKPVKYDKKGRIKKKDSTLAIIADAIIVVVLLLPIPIIISWFLCLAAIVLAIVDLATVKGEGYRHLGSIVAIIFGVLVIFVVCNIRI